MSEHTPGPWRVEQDTTLIWGKCDPEDRSTFGMGYPIAEARVRLGHGSPFCRSAKPDEAEANARLIAAAPALKAMLEELMSVSRAANGISDEYFNRVYDKAQQAIDLANGRDD